MASTSPSIPAPQLLCLLSVLQKQDSEGWLVMRKGMQREAAPRERVDFLTGGSGELQVGFGAHDAEVFQV